MEEMAGLLDALARLAWPALAAVVVAWFGPPLRDMVRSRPFALRIGGIELSAQESTDQLRRQIGDLQSRVASLCGEEPPPPTRPGRGRRRVLWVDDHPRNNAFEIAKLRDDGLEVVEARDTDEALARLEAFAADVVITDMHRDGEGPEAGLALIRAIRQRGLDLPVLVYAGAQAAARMKEEVREAGGDAITASPTELFALLER